MKKLLSYILGLVLLISLNTLSAQICTGCDDPDDASNCGEVDCEFACPNCSNSSPPAPDIPVDNGIGVMIAVGMGLAGVVLYRAYQKGAAVRNA